MDIYNKLEGEVDEPLTTVRDNVKENLKSRLLQPGWFCICFQLNQTKLNLNIKSFTHHHFISCFSTKEFHEKSEKNSIWITNLRCSGLRWIITSQNRKDWKIQVIIRSEILFIPSISDGWEFFIDKVE